MSETEDSMHRNYQKEKCIMAYSKRWAVATNCFLALFFSYTLRLDFSIAIVCMVKSSNGSSADASNSTNHSAAYSQMNDNGRCELLTSGSAVTGKGGEFEWDKTTQTDLLAAFSYGYITTQILGGWLARRYGTRRVLGLSMMITIVATLLTPVCARAHKYLLFAIRLMVGMSQGVSLPAVYNLAGRWAPPLEISRFMTVCNSGYPLGYIVSFGFSGFLCAYGFDNGWGSIFYTFGIGAALSMASWFYFVYDTPAEHPRISSDERKFIESKLDRMDRETERKYPTPWMAIVTSPPFWANVVAYWADDWVNYTLQLGLIVYMKEVLYYDITQNGLLSSLPFIGNFFVSFLTGYLADFVQKRHMLNTVNTRRSFHAIAFVGMAAFIVATGFVDCEDRTIAVVFLTMSRIIYSFCRGGFIPNVMDFAPRYAGEIVGILNTFATIPGFVAPLTIGILTPNGTQQEWRDVFYVCGAMSLFGAVAFGLLTRGEIQKWAKVPETDQEVTVEMMSTNDMDVTLGQSMKD